MNSKYPDNEWPISWLNDWQSNDDFIYPLSVLGNGFFFMLAYPFEDECRIAFGGLGLIFVVKKPLFKRIIYHRKIYIWFSYSDMDIWTVIFWDESKNK